MGEHAEDGPADSGLKVADGLNYTLALLPNRDQLTDAEQVLMRALSLEPELFEARYPGGLLLRKKSSGRSVIIQSDAIPLLKEVLT